MKATKIIENLYYSNVLAMNVYPVSGASVEHDIKEAKVRGWSVIVNCDITDRYLYAQKDNVTPRFLECFGDPDVIIGNTSGEDYYYMIEN